MHRLAAFLIALSFAASISFAESPATQPAGRFPFLEIDAKAKVVRVECEALQCGNPLEFFLCSAGTNEHESVLRSKVRPSHLHAALLMLGLEPGEPVHFSEAADKWIPPHGPPLHISAMFEKDEKTVTLPAYRLLRDIKTKREMRPMTWIFTGSRVMENDVYAADRTGYLISVVNFDLTVIDIPDLASNANDTLAWETNLDLMPAVGTKVTLVIEPAGKVEATSSQPTDGPQPKTPIGQPLITIDEQGKITLDGRPVPAAGDVVDALKEAGVADRRVRVAIATPIESSPAAREVMNALSAARVRFDTAPQTDLHATTRPTGIVADAVDVHVDDKLIQQLRARWEQSVAPHDTALRDAAKIHYDIIAKLRREQQRLIDEADRVQRLIDQLEKKYQDMTTPRPE